MTLRASHNELPASDKVEGGGGEEMKAPETHPPLPSWDRTNVLDVVLAHVAVFQVLGESELS